MRLTVFQKEVPQAGIPKMTSWPVLITHSRARSPTDRGTLFHANGWIPQLGLLGACLQL